MGPMHGRVNFTNCEFEHVYGSVSNLQHFYGDPQLQLIYDTCSFKYDIQDREVVRENLMNITTRNKMFNNNTLMFFNNQSNVVIRRSTFANYNYAIANGVIRLYNNATLLIEDVTFTNMSALNGGLINSVGNNKITIINSKALYLTVQEGIIYASDNSEIIIKNSYFLHNLGQKSVIFSVQGLSSIQFFDSEISYNQAFELNSIGFISNSNKDITFTNVIFKKNKALSIEENSGEVGIGISLCQNSVRFQKCKFIDNEAYTKTPNILANRAKNVTFDQCIFENIQQEKSSTYLGNFIHSVTSSNIFILNSTMSYGRAFAGGAIYAFSYSQIAISGSRFTNNLATEQGGVIYAEGIYSINITDSEFIKNIAESQTGDSLYLLNSFQNATITNSKFIQYSPSNFLNATNIRGFALIDCNFQISNTNIKQVTRTQPASVDFTNIPKIFINNTIFENLQNYRSIGGALTISSALNKISLYTVNIINSQFLNYTGINGGAIYFNDIGKIEINGTLFQNNLALQAGGAIFFYCQNYSDDLEKCNMTIDDSKFINNKANIEGGAIKWNIYQPFINNNTVHFINNSALQYGDDIASVPYRLQRISQIETQSLNSLRRLNDNFDAPLPQLDGVQSGGETDLSFQLVDRNNIRVSTNIESYLYISVIQKGNTGQKEGTLSIEKNSKIKCKNGYYNATMIFVAWPNTTQKIQLAIDGTDFSISGQYYTMDLNFRDCFEGEELLSSGKCRECPAKTYLLTKQLSPMECKPCPDVAACFGGKNIYPKPGYWRSSVYSEKFIECPNKEACLGQNPPTNNPLGACQEGYSGILCSSCKVGYSKIEQSHTCLKCNSTEQAVLRLVGFIFLGILAIVALVYTSLVNADGKKNFLPVFVRIMMNHFQLLVLTSQFELEWPQPLKKFFSIFGSISTVSTQFLAIDCLLDNRDSSNEGDSLQIQLNNQEQLKGTTLDQLKWGMKRVYFIKILLMSILPFIVIIASYFAWVFVYGAKRLRQEFQLKQKKKVVQIGDSVEKASPINLNESAQILIDGNLIHQDNNNLKEEEIKKNKQHSAIANQKLKRVSTIKLPNNSNYINAPYESEQKENEQQKQEFDSNNLNGVSIQNDNYLQMHDSEEKQQLHANQNLQIKSSDLQDNSQENNIKASMNSRIVQTIVIILFMIHPTIATYMLNSFNCDDIDGTKRLSQDLDILCFYGAHQTILYCIVLPSIVLWGKHNQSSLYLGIGIPTLGMIIIFKYRNQLQSHTVKSKFGFIYNGYKVPEGQYWEMYIMYRKIILIFIQVFLIQQGKLVQAMSTLAFIAVCLIINIQKHPFTNLHLNMLETLSLVSSGISVYCGLYYISDIDSKNSYKSSLDEDGKNFLFSLIVISHYFFAMTWIYQFIQEIKSTARQKIRRIYLIICLCNHKDKLEHELQVDEFNQQIAPFIYELDQSREFFKQKIEQYQKDQIPLKEDIIKDIITRYSTYIQSFERDIQNKSKQSNNVGDQEDRMGIQIDDVVRETRFQKLIQTEKQHRHHKKIQSKLSSQGFKFMNKQSQRNQQRHIKHHKKKNKTTLQLEVTNLPEEFSLNEEKSNVSDHHLIKKGFKVDHLKEIQETEEDKTYTPNVRMAAVSHNIRGMAQFYKQAERNIQELFYETSSESQDNDTENQKQGGFSYHNNLVNPKEHSSKKLKEHTSRQDLIEDINSQSFKDKQLYSQKPEEDASALQQKQDFMTKVQIQRKKPQPHDKKKAQGKKLLFENLNKGAISKKRKNDHLKQETNFISKDQQREDKIDFKQDDLCIIEDDDEIQDENERNPQPSPRESSLHFKQEQE